MNPASAPRFRFSAGAARLFLVLATLALVAGASILAARRTDRELRANLLQNTRMVAMAVDLQRVAALSGTSADFESPDYQRLKDQLTRIRLSNPHCRFLYLMGRKPEGTLFFLLDSEATHSKDYSPPGQAYAEASEVCHRVFQNQTATVEGPVPDRWGVWVSALVPLIDPQTDATLAVLGMDIDVSDWKGEVVLRAALPAALASVAVLLGLLAATLYHSRRNLRAQQVKLLESEQRFVQLTEQSRTIAWAVDAHGLYTYVSPVSALVLGYRPDQLVRHRHFYDLHPEPGRDAFKQSSLQVFSRKEALVNWEHPVQALDGRTVWFATLGHPVLTDDGSLHGYRGSHMDITERKQAETAQRKSGEKYRLLIENSHDIIYTLDTNGVFTFVSTAWTTLLGHPVDQVIGKPFQHFVHPEDQAACMEVLHQMIVTGHQQTGVEYRVRHLDGSWRWHVSNGVVLKDEADTVMGFEGIARDITERGQAEKQIRTLLEESNQSRLALLGILEDEARTSKALKVANQMLRLHFEQTPMAVVEWDLDLRVTRWNPAAQAIFGFSPEEAVGQPASFIVPEAVRPHVDQVLQSLLKTEGGQRSTNQNIRKDGTTILCEWYNTALVDEQGTVAGAASLVQDITERKRAEVEKAKLEADLQQAKRMESIGRLAGGVAHDFNNMLTVILGRAEMAIELVDPALPVHADLEEIRKAAARSADLTRQLLAFARKQTVSPRILDLNESVEGVLQMLQRLIGENIALEWKSKAHLWPVKVDPSQIDQILANLCVNARDAITGIGHIVIETENATFDEASCADPAQVAPGEFVQLSVSDNGAGMDRETLSHIFEPFFTTKTLGKGTGLGLATVYGIVKQNHGFIHIDSEPGKGTTIQLYLPRHVGKAEQMQKEGPALPAARGHETLLLVEDEPAILNLTARMISQQGYTVLAASTPGEAIRQAQEHSGEIHLLITDVVMPEMNGRDLAKNLLSLYPQLKRLFMSGYPADVITHQGILEEGVHFIQKPFSQQSLAAKIREVLDSEEN